ncbi:DUF6288 domain-containing protein [Gemmata sp.]|uniref:DUF6288 domain-containing protein n=1 Tax=Gemmata sp. TaxID=1914242 RepID=UPI003F6F891D
MAFKPFALWSGTLIMVALASPATAAPDGPLTVPDFTKGAKIPKAAKHDWNLGPTGLRGWMFCDKMVTTDARQVSVTKVDQGSPADGVFKVGDVILGVGGKAFSYDPRTELGKAITAAESDTSDGKLALTRWRAGTTEEVVLKLPVLGSYSETAPYECAKSKLLLEQGCKALATRMAKPAYAEMDAIPRSLNALALLAGGNPDYLPLVKKEAEWAASYSDRSMQSWYYGYCLLLVSEYVLASGDESVLPGLKRLALETARGQSAVGSWGHQFAIPDGRLGGYGMMNSPGLVLTISLVLAREAGVKDTEVGDAIERSAKLLRFYFGKGAIPYGDHHPWTETHDDNGKSGMGAVLFHLLGEANGAKFFSRMSVASHGAERDCGHTGNYFNILWAMPGVALSGPKATGAWMKEFGTWYFDLARRWDGRYPHQGPPEAEEDSYEGWDSTGGYLLAYAMPLKKIRLTGGGKSVVNSLGAAVAESVIADGRGWNNKDRTSAYDKLSEDQLVERLGSWSPVVRQRAAMAIARRKEFPVPLLLKSLDAPALEARYGACQALIALGDRGEPAVEALRKCLTDKDLWLRIKAAEALAKVGPSAKSAAPKLMEMLTEADKVNDPRGMQQRYLAFALFDSEDGGMLSGSLEGVDREALYKAVRAGLKNQDGRARGSLSSVYRNLSPKEIKPLLPAIHRAILEPAPSGEMFADTIRVEGLRLLAKHRVEEGIRACVQYARDQNPWDSQERTPELMKILLTYGTHAKAFLPELTKLETYFEKDEPNFPKELMRVKAKSVRDTIRAIEKATDTPVLIRLDQEKGAKADPTKAPVKVFILAGQSNMEGHGFIAADPKRNEGKGSLEYAAKDKATADKFKHLLAVDGKWAVRDDVWIDYLDRKGRLTAGFGVKEDRIGPELGFGWVIGDAYEEPVLLVKLAWGGKSLAKDFRPPSAGGEVGAYYTEVVTRTKAVLGDLKKEFPELGDRGYELAGFGWHQGWNDRINQAFVDEYEKNMAHFIRDIRKDLGAEKLPFVIAETGMTGPDEKHPRALALMKAQAAVAGQKEFQGNVAFVGTKEFWRAESASPTKQGYHWNSNAETYYLIGEAMGHAMKKLCDKKPAE